MLCRLSLSRKHIATEGGNHMDFLNASLLYASTSEEANITLVKHVGEHGVLYDWRDPGYSRNGKI
jgi:hypothetical protein